jgi:hypothetical protein
LVNSSSLEIIYKQGMNHFVPWTDPNLIRDSILKLISRENAMNKKSAL